MVESTVHRSRRVLSAAGQQYRKNNVEALGGRAFEPGRIRRHLCPPAVFSTDSLEIYGRVGNTSSERTARFPHIADFVCAIYRSRVCRGTALA